MLDYNKIKETILNKNYSLKYFIPRVTEMTVQGFKLAAKKKTLKISTLEEISKALNLKMSYWWEDDDLGNIMTDISINNKANKKSEIFRLREQHKKDQDTIEILKKNITDLREKLETIGHKERKAG